MSGEEVIPKFSIKRSEELFLGKCEAKDIAFVALLPSNQRSIYPIPELDLRQKIKIATDRKFIGDFTESFKPQTSAMKDMPENFSKSFHLYVVFYQGDSACLHGALYGKKFLIQPMFKDNSIAIMRNNLYNMLSINNYLFKEDFPIVK